MCQSIRTQAEGKKLLATVEGGARSRRGAPALSKERLCVLRCSSRCSA